jgi:hypothetical protein
MEASPDTAQAANRKMADVKIAPRKVPHVSMASSSVV